jgi:MFS family permease
MNKILLGLLLGGFLGIFDGLTAWFTPEVRAQLLGIVIGSTFKGLITGVLIGYFAKKVNSLPLGIIFGLAVGLILAFLVAAMPNPAGKHYYFEIMLPGGILGMIVGYATQRFGQATQVARR